MEFVWTKKGQNEVDPEMLTSYYIIRHRLIRFPQLNNNINNSGLLNVLCIVLLGNHFCSW